MQWKLSVVIINVKWNITSLLPLTPPLMLVPNVTPGALKQTSQCTTTIISAAAAARGDTWRSNDEMRWSTATETTAEATGSKLLQNWCERPNGTLIPPGLPGDAQRRENSHDNYNTSEELLWRGRGHYSMVNIITLTLKECDARLWQYVWSRGALIFL